MPNDERDEQRAVAYLLYDGRCGPCTRFKNIVLRIDVNRKLIPIPLESNFAYQLVQGKQTRTEMMQAFHVVYAAPPSENPDEDGRIFTAGEALIELMRLLPLGSFSYWIITHFIPLKRLVKWFYPHLAELRAISVTCRVS